jgi:hypothetical protein
MVFTATYTITDDFSTNLVTNYDENFSIEVLDCGNSSIINLAAPTTWITNLDGSPITSTIFLDAASNPSFKVAAFTMSSVCSNDIASPFCCSNTITYSLKTFLSDNSEILGFASIDASRQIATDLTKRSPRSGENYSQTLKLKVTATTVDGVVSF